MQQSLRRRDSRLRVRTVVGAATVTGALLATGLTAAPAHAAVGDYPITGTVRYLDGTPVAGGCVQFTIAEPSSTPGINYQKPLAYTVTDQTGTFSFAPPQVGNYVVFFTGIDPACSLTSQPTKQFHWKYDSADVSADGTVKYGSYEAARTQSMILLAAPSDRVFLNVRYVTSECSIREGRVEEAWGAGFESLTPTESPGSYEISYTVTDALGKTVMTGAPRTFTARTSESPTGGRYFSGTPYGTITVVAKVTAPDGSVTTASLSAPEDTTLCTTGTGTGNPTVGGGDANSTPAIRVNIKRATATGYLAKKQVRKVKLQRQTSTGAWKTVKTKKTSSKTGKVKFYSLKKRTPYRLYAPRKALNRTTLPATQSRTFTR